MSYRNIPSRVIASAFVVYHSAVTTLKDSTLRSEIVLNRMRAMIVLQKLIVVLCIPSSKLVQPNQDGV